MNTISKQIITFCVVIATLISCKNSEKEEKTEEIQDKSLHIIVEAIVPKDDSFQIYWNEDGTDNFTAEKFVNIDVKGNVKAQVLDFKLPEDSMAKQLRFDIGSNKEHGQIKLVSFKFKFMDKIFTAPITDFWKYFGNNTSIDYDKKTATAKLITNLPEGFDPIFGGTSNIPIELEKLFTNK